MNYSEIVIGGALFEEVFAVKKSFGRFLPLMALVLSLLLWGGSVAHAAEGLTIRRATFANEIIGLSQYTPRAGGSFTLDDTCMVYVEASGFAMPLTPDTEDEYNISLAADLAVKLPRGRRLLFQPNIALQEGKVRSLLPLYFLSFAFSFEGWTPGNYILEVGLRDNFSGQVVSQDLTLQVVEP
jgi:hypothetical protein